LALRSQHIGRPKALDDKKAALAQRMHASRGVVKKRVTRYMSDWVSAPVGSWSKQAGDPPYGCG